MSQKVAKKATKVAASVELAPVANDTSSSTALVLVKEDQSKTDNKTLYVMVTTLDEKGKLIGERVVDMYHFGTRKWLHDHLWWATHNTHRVEIQDASPTDVDAYLASQRQKLADKFNK